MSESAETLRPESGPTGHRFIVTVTEEFTVERHQQDYQQIGVHTDSKSPAFGYLTKCVRKEETRTIFKGEFTERPQISALAALMERPANGGAS